MNKMIIASTSTVHGGSYLSYLLPNLDSLYKDIPEIVFIPYASPGGISYDNYTDIVRRAFKKINKSVIGLHQSEDAKEMLKRAQAVFVGGGNTFLLVSTLYTLDIMDTLRNIVLNGTPYLGTSAGSNITGPNMQTTNDMPIIYPPSFNTLGLIPFNINPHYIDPIENSTHMGETRETRIKEFHTLNDIPVLGLREGSWLEIKGDQILLKGPLSARAFEKNKKPYEIEPDKTISF